MKKIFTLLTALLCTVVQVSWAQDCPALNEAGEKSYSAAGGGSVEYPLSGEGYAVTFEAYKTAATAVGDGIILQEYVNNSWQKVAGVSIGDLSKNSFKSFGPYTISRTATKIRFYSSGSYSRHIRNVYVTRATYVDAPKDASLTFEKKTVNSATSELSTTILWGNTSELSATISGEGATQFAATISDNAATCTNGTATVAVTYKHNVVGTHSATLTLSNGSYSHTIALSGTTEKKTQYIVWAEGARGGEIT